MDPNIETCQSKKRDGYGGVGDLLKKINHAAKSSQHFRSSLSSLIKTSTAPSNGDDHGPLQNHCTETISSFGSNRDGGVKRSKRISSKTVKNSSTIVTSTPHHDGYQWRKYGEKKLASSKFPRMYYRCTYHRELNCGATKQVQQHTEGDSPMYKVSYFYEHTCTNISMWDTNSTVNYQQMLDFSVKETNCINIQPSTSSLFCGPDHQMLAMETSQQAYDDQGLIEFENSMECDLSWYEEFDIDELL